MGILSGLALFLFGMHLMSQSLQRCVNDYMKHILAILTSNKYQSILIGIVLTAFMQSSSAMTLMLISFLNSQMISIDSAIWLLMGANIGTTITGQIMALDMSRLAPFLAIVGVVILLSRYEVIGEVLIGLGLLFMGLDILQIGLSTVNIDMFFKLNHPLIMILYGFLLTAIIQSSSAAIGILQSLVVKSVIPFDMAIYLIFGFNIGSCMTGLLASLVSHRDAKRLALFHLLMNVLGSIVFYILCRYTSFVTCFETIVINPSLKVAHMHTFFNIATTLLMLFFDQYLLRIVDHLLPVQKLLANESEEC